MMSAPAKPTVSRMSPDAPARESSTTAGDEVVRVCFVIDNLARAGTESQVVLLLRQLDRARFCPYLCLLDGQDETSRELEPDDVPILRLGVRRLLSANAVRQAYRFWRFLRTERIDIVQTYFTDSMCFAAPVARAAGVRAVFGSRRNIGHWMTRQDRWICRVYNRLFIDKIVANCEAARQSAIEQERVKPQDVFVVPNSIDLDRFRHIAPWQPKAAAEPCKVGMVGNLREVKGVDLFIRAAGVVLEENPDIQFVIAGGGNPAPYQALIDELGIANQVRLLGETSDVPAFLATLDVAVLPSRAEGFSNALLEYMAAGRPVVATDVGGNAATLGPMARECCVPPGDHSLIADGISRLLDDESRAAKLAQTARSRAFADLGGQLTSDIFYTYCRWPEKCARMSAMA